MLLMRLLVIFTLLQTGVLLAQTSTKTTGPNPELLALLPLFTTPSVVNLPTLPRVVPKYPNEARILFLMDSIAELNKKLRFMTGYRIQVYSGPDKDAANSVKESIYKKLPYADIYTTYKQPTYKIKLGDFSDRLEAYRVLHKILRSEFAGAIVIQDNILIKRK